MKKSTTMMQNHVICCTFNLLNWIQMFWFFLATLTQSIITRTGKQEERLYIENGNDRVVVEDAIFVNLKHAIEIYSTMNIFVSIHSSLFRGCYGDGSLGTIYLEGQLNIDIWCICYYQCTSNRGVLTIKMEETDQNTIDIQYNTLHNLDCTRHPIQLTATYLMTDIPNQDSYVKFTSFEFNNMSGIKTSEDFGILSNQIVRLDYQFNTFANNDVFSHIISHRYFYGSASNIVCVNNTDIGTNNYGMIYLNYLQLTITKAYFYNNKAKYSLFHAIDGTMILKECYIDTFSFTKAWTASTEATMIITIENPDNFPIFNHYATGLCHAQIPYSKFDSQAKETCCVRKLAPFPPQIRSFL